MNEQNRKTPSIASLSSSLAWNLLTPEEQRNLLEYLDKVHEWTRMKIIQKEQARKILDK